MTPSGRTIRSPIAPLFIVAFATLGCATTTYDVSSRGTTTQVERASGTLPFVMTSGPSDTNDYVVRLSHPICETVAITPITTTTYTKPSTGGAIAFIGAGLAVAALGTASWVSARDQPRECPDGDDSCITRDEAKGTAGLLWGLGGAGVGLGIYRLAQQPKVRGTYPHDETLPAGVPPHECAGPSIADVSVTLSYGGGGLVTTTDNAGFAVFPTCKQDLTEGCIDVTRIPSSARASVRADRYDLGSVHLGSLQGTGTGTDTRGEQALSNQGTLSQEEKLFVSSLMCAVKLWGGNVCVEKLGGLLGSPGAGVALCAAGKQYLEGKPFDPESIGGDIVVDRVAKELKLEWLAALVELGTCVSEQMLAQ